MERRPVAARGVVISVHEYGATVRLEDGALAAVPATELAAHRPAFTASYRRRTPLDLELDRSARHPVAYLSRERVAPPEPPPALVDPAFEARIGAYLKATEEWAPPDRPAPAERHFIRKKRRAAVFEARTKAT